MKKYIICGLVIILAVAVFLQVTKKGVQLAVQGEEVQQGETELRFNEIATDFKHSSDFNAALPFMGLSAIDVDNDGVDEVFVGGGIGQQDAILVYENSALSVSKYGSAITKESSDPTYGAMSIDATGDGLADLFIARQSGVYFYTNTGSGFSGAKVDFPLDRKSMPLSISAADINRDGAVDLYISNYIRPEFVEGETIFNDLEYGGTNNLLLNNGDNTFTDITKQAGVFHQHNTFLSVFADLNDDGHSELVVAHDTGVPSIYKNNGDSTFSEVSLPVTFSYPMGIAVSDYNNDGKLDLYFSNVGNTLPVKLLRGDLSEDQVLNTDYILLENQGDLVFKDVAKAHNAAMYGFGWGLVSYDFNNDALADYLISQNYIRFPGASIPGLFDLYPGRLLQQKNDGQFQAVEEMAGLSNKKFGVNMVVTDFNDDGWPDVVLGNLDSELRAFLNAGGTNHWLKVRLPDVPSSLGAIVTVETSSGKKFVNQVYTSEGLGSDQSHELFFGLGEEAALKNV
ncbi:MAG: FG-GAP repeat domain-containing protein, partial [Pseudomonadales bacterium]